MKSQDKWFLSVVYSLGGMAIICLVSLLQHRVFDREIFADDFIVPAVFGLLVGYIVSILQASHEESSIQQRRAFEYGINIVERLNSGVISFDKQGIVTYANPSMAALLGLSREAIEGRPISDFMFGVDKEEFLSRILGNASEDLDQREIVFSRSDGKIVYVMAAISPAYVAGGIHSGYLMALQSQERQKNLENMLRRMERFHRTIVESLPL